MITNNKNGILVHKYGPHIFHTQMEHVWDYLSNFTKWHKYEHKVLGFIDGKNVPIPFNITSLYEIMDYNVAKCLEDKLIKNFGYGKIDEFFNYKFGKLPYRSLKFDFENINKECFQDTGAVNFPNDYDFTRITEFKHLTGQKSSKTTIVKEYPQEHNKTNIPYYPIPQKENLYLYKSMKKKHEI